MIASVRGRVTALTPGSAVVEVGGVGLEVQCTPATLARLRPGDDAALTTALVVREDSLTLYGFRDADEREVFETLQTASGVGPRLAQAVLATYTPEEVRRAVATEDLAALTRVSGIGRKGAQRIVLELKDRLGAPGDVTTGLAPSSHHAWQDQVRAGLLGLGYAVREADEALASVAADAGPAPDPGELLRAALGVLRRS